MTTLTPKIIEQVTLTKARLSRSDALIEAADVRLLLKNQQVILEALKFLSDRAVWDMTGGVSDMTGA